MGGSTRYFRIGMFLITGFVLGAAGIVVFGAGAFSAKSVKMETYINESVQGLSVGSPVRLRGVQIGKVEEISLVYSEYATGLDDPIAQDFGRLVVVRVGLAQKIFEDQHVQDIGRTLEAMVKKGLRIRMASQGITGVAYLELDYLDPEKNPVFEPKWTPNSWYIPAAASTATRLTDSAENVVNSLEKAELDKLSKDIDSLVTDVARTIRDDVSPALKSLNATLADLAPAVRNVSEASAELTPALKNVRQISDDLGPAAKDIRAATEKLPDTMEHANSAALRADEALAGITKRIDDLSAKLNTLVDSLQHSVDTDLSPTLANLHATSGDLPAVLDSVRFTLKRVDHLVAGEQEDVTQVVQDLRAVSRDLQEFSGYAKRYPAHVLFGNPPPPRERK